MSAPMTPAMTPTEILRKLVAFPTVSRDSNLDLIAWVEDFLAQAGIDSVRVPSPCGTKSAIYASTGPDVEGGIILSGHTDVVPVDGQDWTHDPWDLVERDGKLFGRGAVDMKGFDALALAAMVQAKAQGVARPLQLALSYDEEVGCTGAAPMIAAMAAGLPRAGAVIVGEPSMMKVVSGHKGGTGYHVHLHGHEVHSSIMHTGVNAIMEAAHLIDWANARNAENRAAKPGEMAARFDPPWTTVHVGTIEGGTAHNITAGDCRMGLDFRVVPGEDVDDWVAAFTARVAEVEAGMKAVHPGAGITLDRYFTVPALVPEHGWPGRNARPPPDRGQRGPRGQLRHRGRAFPGAGLFLRGLRAGRHRPGAPGRRIHHPRAIRCRVGLHAKRDRGPAGLRLAHRGAL